jgi:hypothetical protein
MNGQGPAPRGTHEQAVAERARALFERSVAGIDLASANRLRLARRTSFARTPAGPRWWLPLGAGGAAAVLVLGLAWWLPASMPAAPAAPPLMADAGALPLPGDADADLYAWLGEAPVAVAAEPATPGAL